MTGVEFVEVSGNHTETTPQGSVRSGSALLMCAGRYGCGAVVHRNGRDLHREFHDVLEVVAPRRRRRLFGLVG